MEAITNDALNFKLSKDKVTATITFNRPKEELNEEKDFYIGEILKTLHQHHVTEGIQVELFERHLVPHRAYTVAKGIPPVDGKDAEVHYYPLSERKPTILQDGKADYYEMNFIDEVKKGDWLGEKIRATGGTPGKTVTGEVIVPKKGKDVRLLYDYRTVEEIDEGDKVVLRSLMSGVVTYQNGKISVGDHLFIKGDVGIETGNIDFDGSITIEGIVQSGYTVKATKDISVLGEMGLSGVRMIMSHHGDIFIKGGLFGQGESIVKAGKNIYIKHANDCILEAKEDIHIGYYSIGSSLIARCVYADEKVGKIIGGKVEAKGKVTAAIIGNRMGRKTIIQVEGFERRALTRELENQLLEYKEEVLSYEGLKNQLEAYENAILTQREERRLKQLKEEIEEKLAIIQTLDENCKYLASFLNIRGEGELVVTEQAYPETFLQMKGTSRRFTTGMKGIFYTEGHMLYFK